MNMRRWGSRPGQVMAYFLFMMVILVMSWAMMLNIARLLTDRMKAQNAADSAALSVAVLRARTLNLLGELNWLMATGLSFSAFPALVPLQTFNTSFIGGSAFPRPFPFSDYKCNGYSQELSTEYEGVNRLRFFVRTIGGLQRSLITAYAVNSLRLAQNAATASGIRDGALVLPSRMVPVLDASPYDLSAALRSAMPETLLGLRRNTNRITYYKTVNVGATTSTHKHFVFPQRWCTENVTWYIADDSFWDHKVVSFVRLPGTHARGEGYPILRSFFSIRSWPDIYAVAAAATWNDAGPMFPEREAQVTGIPDSLIPVSGGLMLAQLAKLRLLALEVSAIPGAGPFLSAGVWGMIAAAAATAANSLYVSQAEDTTPVRSYEKAKGHGWDAHLVPIGQPGISH